MKSQPLLDRNGWYPVGLDFPYLSPNVLSVVVNYKHDKFAITPAVTFNQGVPYGNPADVVGIDPRTCKKNSHLMLGGIATSNPDQADYTTCALADTQSGTSPGTLFIPNPATGAFDTFGAFEQPSQLNLSMSFLYAITPNVKASLLLANLAQRVFRRVADAVEQAVSAKFLYVRVHHEYLLRFKFLQRDLSERPGRQRRGAQSGVRSAIYPRVGRRNVYVLPGPFNAYLQFTLRL